jgi:7,8-dihydro-6-hydroxymethylpterin dimethyltransferase
MGRAAELRRTGLPNWKVEEPIVKYLTAEEIKSYPIDPRPAPDADRHAIVRARLESVGQYGSRQQLGNRMAIGCVALEITQRCNLDCTCCYLSEHSEAVRDLPLDEVFRRIDTIAAYYGPGTAVQITGGDPTLRKKSELLEIVRRVRAKGLRPSLFTNGIKAPHDYLKDLAEAGLADVAFHVDLTQERKGYATEVELNEIRSATSTMRVARGSPCSSTSPSRARASTRSRISCASTSRTPTW